MGFAQMGHICNQCGWGYPKPHPSAKQRRAHRKVCGKLEGFEVKDGQRGQCDEEDEQEGFGNGEMERQFSCKSEEDVFSDAYPEFTDLKGGGNAAIENIHPSYSPIQEGSSGALQVENDAQTEHHSINSTTDQVPGFILDNQANLTTLDTKEANGSSSDVPIDGDIDETETFEDVDSLPYIVKDVDTKGICESNGIPSATEVPTSDTESRESEFVVPLQEIERDEASTTAISDGIVDSRRNKADSSGQKLTLSESGGSEYVLVSGDNFHDDRDSTSKPYVDHNDNASGGYNVKDLVEILPVLSRPASMPSEEHPKGTTKDYQSTSEATETGAQKEISESSHPGFLLSNSGESDTMPPLATPVPEDSYQEEALCSKKRAMEVFIEQDSGISEVKNKREGQELHNADISVSHGDDIKETENDDPLLVETRKDFPEQDGHYTRDAVAGNFVQRKSESESSSSKMNTTLETEPHDSLQDVSFKSLPQNHGPVAATDNNVVSSEDVAADEAIDGVSRKDDTHHEDQDEQYNRGGAINENSVQRYTDSETSSYLSDLEECFQETKSSSSQDINNSSAMPINTSQFDNTTGSAALDSQNPHGENHLESSKEPEIKGIENSAQAELFGVDESSEKSHEEYRNACINEPATPQNNTEKTAVERSAPSTLTAGVDDEDLLLEKLLKDMAIGHQDGSVDSFQQTDSVEGYWGSPSDATVVSSSTSTPKEKVQETESNKSSCYKDECLSKPDTSKPPSVTRVDSGKGSIQNQHQFHISSLQAAISESQERNMTTGHTGNVSNLSSPKTRAPLKDFLAELNFDNKQDGTAQVHPKSPTHKDGGQSKTQPSDNGLKTYVDNEWNSPAKLPKHAQRKKSMFLPFLCCSSVN